MFKNLFPIFKNIPDLIYLDSAASAQKPQQVVDSINAFYTKGYSNVHRGNYTLSEDATVLYESVRKNVADFIGAESDEIIFTSGTTDSLNKLAQSVGLLIQNQPIISTVIEHHSNFLPWQQLGLKKGSEFIITDLTSDYKLNIENLYSLVAKYQPLILALTHMSNVTGSINPIKEISARVKALSPKTIIVVDAAQSIAHIKINVNELGCDALAFSGHKMFASTGIGVLYVKKSLLNKLEPTFYGGGMIAKVERDNSTWANPPASFEAGTPNIEGVISLGSAIDFINSIGYKKIADYEDSLSEYFLTQINKNKFINLLGPNTIKDHGPVFSFMIDKIHPHDISTLLDEDNIAVRAGHHCAQILHREIFKISASVRVSFSVYNTVEDIDKLFISLNKIKNKFNK